MGAWVFQADGGAFLTVSAPAWVLARNHAQAILQADAVEHFRARHWGRDFDLRFVGSDARGGGSPDGRRLQVRERVCGAWTPWADA